LGAYRKQDIVHPRSCFRGELGRYYGQQLDQILRRGSGRHACETTQNGSQDRSSVRLDQHCTRVTKIVTAGCPPDQRFLPSEGERRESEQRSTSTRNVHVATSEYRSCSDSDVMAQRISASSAPVGN